MSYFKIKSYAKINLALNVIGKSKKLHKIETIVSFLELHDEIKIKKIEHKNHKIIFRGKFSSGIKSKNSLSHLLSIIEKKRLLENKYQIIVKKNIPSKAGLGGGSMNAASILRFLINERLIKVKKKEILEICNLIGSDVFLGFSHMDSILRKNKLIKILYLKKKFNVLIVKPSFGCLTKKIYSRVKKFTKPEFNTSVKNKLSTKFLKQRKNDLESIAFSEYPRLKNLKNFLDKLTYAKFNRMTGSGSAIISYFSSAKKCKEAEKKVKNQFRNYWCITSKTI